MANDMAEIFLGPNGKLEYVFAANFPLSGTGTNVARKFLRDTSKYLPGRILHYYDTIGDVSFLRRESNSKALLMASFESNGYATLMEFPATKKRRSKNDSSGRVDFFVYERDDGRYIFLIELKHTWVNYSGKKFKHQLDTWSDANFQAKSLCNKVVRGEIGDGRAYSIAFYLMPIWKKTKAEVEIEADDEYDIGMISDKLRNTLPSNYSCYWKTPKSYRYAFADGYASHNSFFAGFFVAANMYQIPD